MSSTVNQPIRAELNIEQHFETANQSRVIIHDYSLLNKVITDHLILGRNSRVVNGHEKLFLENFCP